MSDAANFNVILSDAADFNVFFLKRLISKEFSPNAAGVNEVSSEAVNVNFNWFKTADFNVRCGVYNA